MLQRKIRNKEKSDLIINHKKADFAAEQFRKIRTNLKFSMFDTLSPTIVITSAAPESGKSFIAANLAAFFAGPECRVLLIDSDLRKPRQHKIFGAENKDGLSSLLFDKRKSISDIVNVTSVYNLFLLTSGPVPPNPAELLATFTMDKVIKEAKNHFDIILFDMPPILSVTDAQIVASKTDGTIFVVPSGKVKKSELIRSKQLLDNVRANVLGSILNYTDKKSDSYTYSSNKYFKYR